MSVSHENFEAGLLAVLPRLRRFARTLTRQPNDADDLVQVAVERALLRREQWQSGLPLANWMFGIMKNAWVDEVRTRGRRCELFAPAEAGENVGASVVDAAMEIESVQAAMARLPEEQRMAVALVLIEGLSYKEAAHVMEIPIGTLTSRIARGRDMLQALLNGSPAPARGSSS